METLRSKTSHGPTGRLRTQENGENGAMMGDLVVKNLARSGDRRERGNDGRPGGQEACTVPQGGFALRTPARTEQILYFINFLFGKIMYN